MIDVDLFNALKGLVANRVYPIAFPQVETLMAWPAIRYTFVSDDPIVSVCGDGESDSDVRVQLDLVHVDADSLRLLKSQVKAVMAEFEPPALKVGDFELFDDETRTYRAVVEYVIYQ